MQDKEISIKKINSVKSIEDKINSKILSNNEIAKNQLNEILVKMPTEIRNLIDAAFTYKRIPKEYMLSSILFAFSNAAGLAFKIHCMNYTNYSNLYFALVGSRGDAKSPAMELATELLRDYDEENYQIFKEKEKAAKDNEFNDVKPFFRKQLLVQNATIEAAQYIHYNNKYSIGIFVDELSFLIDKMANKNSNEGAVWRTFLLQGSTNKHVDVSRKTTDSYFIKNTFPTLLGSIQYQFIPKMFANGNLESGFIDRLLFCYKLTDNKVISEKMMPFSFVDNYKLSLDNLFKRRKSLEENRQDYTVVLNKDSEKRIIDYSSKMLKIQDDLLPQEREYVSKMLIGIHKLSLLVHLIKNAYNSDFSYNLSVDSVELASLINDFYYTNFKIVLEKNNFSFDEKSFVINVVKKGIENNVAQKEIAKLTGRTPGNISKLYKKHSNQ